MLSRWLLLSLLTLTACAPAVVGHSPVAAARPATPAARAIDIADAAVPDPHSQVLVLGTAHLSSLPKNFDRALFSTLLDRLAAWQPQIVTVESLTGAECDYLRAFAFAYEDTAETYCPDAAPARAALHLDQAGAEQAIEALLATPAATRPPAERRRLAALFLAAGDPTSAHVQWLRLDPAARIADAVLTASLVTQVEKRMTRLSENGIIAAALAARLGLERVYPIDDHSGGRATGPTDESYGTVIQKAWDNPAVAQRRAEDESWNARLVDRDAIIGWYRYLNAPETQRLAVTGDFAAAAAAAPDPAYNGRKYLAYWETRNMRIAANIRQAIGPTPGVRALVIIGASHKSYLERDLGTSSEIEFADLDKVLGPPSR